MKILKIVPYGWPCSLEECPPGHLVFGGEHLGYKTEYSNGVGKIDAYNAGGETLCISETEIVQPVIAEWEEI